MFIVEYHKYGRLWLNVTKNKEIEQHSINFILELKAHFKKQTFHDFDSSCCDLNKCEKRNV